VRWRSLGRASPKHDEVSASMHGATNSHDGFPRLRITVCGRVVLFASSPGYQLDLPLPRGV